MNKKEIYKVSFISDSKVYEIYARSVSQSNLMGFIEVSDFVFGETSKVLVDPNEERLKVEFTNVKCSYIPMHAILRIDQVTKEGASKIKLASGNKSKVTHLPSSYYSNTDDKGGDS